MKSRLLFLLLSIAAASFGAAASRDEKKVEPLLLTAADEFPEEYRVAVRAVTAAMPAEGYKPNQYFASISSMKGGLLEIYLTHEVHPSGGHSRGDLCGRCRTASFNPKSGRLSPFQGVR